MASPGGVLGPQTMWLVLGIAALAMFGMRAFSPPTPDLAEPFAQLAIGDGKQASIVRINRRECLSQPNRLWAVFEGGVECIAYVAAGSQAGSATVVYFTGDIGEARLGESAQTMLRETYARRAASLSRKHDVAIVVVGRPGLMGSSGFHLLGGRRDEATVISAALDALKNKLSINRLALAGQSGGARIIAQLLIMGRSDIACAAMASGAYGLPRLKGGGTSRTNIFGAPAQRYLVPLRHADGIVTDRTRRSFVIGDSRDAVVPFVEQQEWAKQLRAHGHHVALIEARAADPEHHGLSSQAMQAAALCAKGRTDAELTAAVLAGR